MLIAGAAIMIISYVVAIPYFLPQGSDGAEYSIRPGEATAITHNLSPGQAAFSVNFQELPEKPVMTVKDQSGKVLYNGTATGSPFVVPVNASAAGNYTLFIANPSSETLRAVVLVGDEATAVTLGFIQIAGIMVLAAGAIVTVLDSRRSKKMRQFGDVSDLR